MNSIRAVLGVLYNRQDHLVLIAERPEGKPGAGFWEFPGGKIESDESLEEALCRELNEEIGIDVSESALSYLLQLRIPYPPNVVFLDCFYFESWNGTPHGREGQQLA
jgi:8-oxo-dGTP diphosphatase